MEQTGLQCWDRVLPTLHGKHSLTVAVGLDEKVAQSVKMALHDLALLAYLLPEALDLPLRFNDGLPEGLVHELPRLCSIVMIAFEALQRLDWQAA